MGNINWKLLIITSVAGVIGATLGTMFMQKKLNAQSVKKILAVILLLMAAKLIWNLLYSSFARYVILIIINAVQKVFFVNLLEFTTITFPFSSSSIVKPFRVIS